MCLPGPAFSGACLCRLGAMFFVAALCRQMVFNSLTFLAFLAIVLPVYYRLDHRRQNIFLLFASYFFYGWWDVRFLGLL